MNVTAHSKFKPEEQCPKIPLKQLEKKFCKDEVTSPSDLPKNFDVASGYASGWVQEYVIGHFHESERAIATSYFGALSLMEMLNLAGAEIPLWENEQRMAGEVDCLLQSCVDSNFTFNV